MIAPAAATIAFTSTNTPTASSLSAESHVPLFVERILDVTIICQCQLPINQFPQGCHSFLIQASGCSSRRDGDILFQPVSTSFFHLKKTWRKWKRFQAVNFGCLYRDEIIFSPVVSFISASQVKAWEQSTRARFPKNMFRETLCLHKRETRIPWKNWIKVWLELCHMNRTSNSRKGLL